MKINAINSTISFKNTNNTDTYIKTQPQYNTQFEKNIGSKAADNKGIKSFFSALKNFLDTNFESTIAYSADIWA